MPEQKEKHSSEPSYMHDFKPPTSELYRCPVLGCGCLWKKGKHLHKVLADANQKHCDVCASKPLSGLIELEEAKLHLQSMRDELKQTLDPTDFPGIDKLPINAAGQKFDQDKVRMELLPIEALMGTAKVLTFGARKYSDRNWENGIEYSRVYGALMRHITAWWNGEDLDPETGLSHLHHAGCCIAFLQTYVERKQTGLDDRPHTEAPVDA